MTFKEFIAWCNARAYDGCWGLREAVICLNITKHIYETPFWKRRKAWEAIEKDVMKNIIDPINEKIETQKTSSDREE